MKNGNGHQHGIALTSLQLLAVLVVLIGSSLSVSAAPAFPSKHHADCHMSERFVPDAQAGCAERGSNAACVQHCLATAILVERIVEAGGLRGNAFPLSPDTGGVGAIVPVSHGPPKA